MAAPEVHLLFHHPIADHSFSADKQTLAVARDNNVELYKKSGSKFILQDELKGHDKTVTSVDIAPRSGKIVTCSQGKKHACSLERNTRLTLSRSQCLCLGALAQRMEADFGTFAHQPCSNICALVAV